MEIRNIISFLKVNELSSFSKAAKELGYTQSNISSHISQLEKELNCQLFERFGKKIYLTEQGKQFLPLAKDIISSVDLAKETIGSVSVPKELRIGILESLCTAYMPRLVSEFHKSFPEVVIVIKTDTFDNLSNMLNDNQIDLLWTFEEIFESPLWTKALEQPEDICIITSNKNNHFESVDISSLNNASFIFTEKNCSYRNAFERVLNKELINYNVFMEIGNTEIIKKFVSAGLCLSVLPRFAIEDDLTKNELCILPVKDFSMHMYSQIFYHNNKTITPVMIEFLNLLTNTLK